jgi:hypothetical protein
MNKSAEDARKDAQLWACRSEGDDDIYAPEEEFESLWQGSYQPEPAVVQTLMGNILRRQTTEQRSVTKDCPILGKLLGAVDANPPRQSDDGILVPGLPVADVAGDRIIGRKMSQRAIAGIRAKQREAHRRRMGELEGGELTAAGERPSHAQVLNGFGEGEVVFPGPEDHPLLAESSIALELGPSPSYMALGRKVADLFTLNRLQRAAHLMIMEALDANHGYEGGNDGDQHLQYVGGEGGTGKSRVIDAVRRVLEEKNEPGAIMVTATSGSAAAEISGTTIHSALGIVPTGTDGNAVEKDDSLTAGAYQDAQKAWRWQRVKVLVVDEVSMLGGALLHRLDERLRHLRARNLPFGGLLVVLFSGDFFQFGPVLQKSILFPSDASGGKLSATALNHHHAHELWLRFKHVVILQEQVRACGDPELRSLLTKLRNFQQDSDDLALINSRVVKDGKIPYDDDTRVITPLNRHRWDLNSQAVMMWAKRRGKTVSIFMSSHKWTGGQPSEEEMMRVFEQGDDNDCPIPATFAYADGMPIMVNENVYLGLKVVNGSIFEAAGVVPDSRHRPVRATVVVTDERHAAAPESEMDIIIYFGPPSTSFSSPKTRRISPFQEYHPEPSWCAARK